MASVFRADYAETLGRPVRTNEGFLRVDAYLTASGVFPYQDASGKTRYEYRPPEAVFSESALASWRDKPVTDDHPPEMVTPENAAKYRKGHIVGDSLRREGNRLRGTLHIDDAGLIGKVEAGKVQLSGGYWCEVSDSAGVSPEGQRYDAVQGNYYGNHEAFVHEARIPGSAARLDGAAFMRTDSGAREVTRMVKVKIGGAEFEVPEAAAQLLEHERADAKKTLDEVRGELKATASKLDAAEKARADAADPKRFDAAVNARVALQVQAEKHGVKCDGLTDRQIKLAVVEKLDGEKPTDADSDDFVNAYFKRATKSAAAGAEAVGAALVATTVAAVVTDGAPQTAEQARAEMIKRNREAFNQKGAA